MQTKAACTKGVLTLTLAKYEIVGPLSFSSFVGNHIRHLNRNGAGFLLSLLVRSLALMSLTGEH